MVIIKVNDTELFYTKFGSGTPFLVMHGGLGLDHTYFRPELDPLGDYLHLFTLIIEVMDAQGDHQLTLLLMKNLQMMQKNCVMFWVMIK